MNVFIQTGTAPERMRAVNNMKLKYVSDALLDIICSGTFERFPRLKFVLVENEPSWLPFVLSQWDKTPLAAASSPPQRSSCQEYYRRNVYATFFNDAPIGWLLRDWEQNNLMWSNDFPHPNSTWPNSREVIARDLGHLPATKRAKLLSGTAAELYSLSTKQLAASGR